MSGSGTVTHTVQREFWLERWRTQQIGFHQGEVNGRLKQYWPEFGVAPDEAVFVPLCGKSVDMLWLSEHGHRVIGVELAESAVRAFFDEAGLPFQMERERHLLRYSHRTITVYCGDVMDLTGLHLRGVGGVYDRAGLIALPPGMRAHYADHLQRIVPDGSRMLLLTLEYDQSKLPGPPHAVLEDEVRALFGGRCRVDSLCRAPARALPPSFAEAGVADASEVAYRIVKVA
jgi:thiopurine S-methyltransferase